MLMTPGVPGTFLGPNSACNAFGSPWEGSRIGSSREDLVESTGVAAQWHAGRSAALRLQLPAPGAPRRVSLTSGRVESARLHPELRFASQAPDTSEVPGAPGAN